MSRFIDSIREPRIRWRLLIAVALIAYFAVLARHACYFFAGPDSAGYGNEARMLASGRLRIPVEPLRTFDLDPRTMTTVFTPWGFTNGGNSTLVPTYPAGMPLHMVVAAKIGGWTTAPFLVAPLMAIGCLLLLYGLAAEVGLERAYRVAAMAILAFFPSFIALGVQPVSDIPATFWTLATIWFAMRSSRVIPSREDGEESGRRTAPPPRFLALFGARNDVAFAAAAGAAFAIGIWVRPTDFLVAIPLACAMRWSIKRLSIAILASLPFGLALMWFNNALYGSPLRTGYGTFRDVITPSVFTKCGPNHIIWLFKILSPLVMPLALLVFAHKRVDRWTRATLATWFGIFWCFYAIYDVCEGEGDIRFLLPAISSLILGSLLVIRWLTSYIRTPIIARVVAALGVVLILARELHYCGPRWHVLHTAEIDSIYPETIRWAEARLPRNAFVISGLMTGAFYYYANRLTARWDQIEGARYDALNASAASALPWYAVVSVFEADGEELARRMPGRWVEVGTFRSVKMWRREH